MCDCNSIKFSFVADKNVSVEKLSIFNYHRMADIRHMRRRCKIEIFCIYHKFTCDEYFNFYFVCKFSVRKVGFCKCLLLWFRCNALALGVLLCIWKQMVLNLSSSRVNICILQQTKDSWHLTLRLVSTKFTEKKMLIKDR